MINPVKHVKDLIQGKSKVGEKPRSGKWPALRKKWLELNPKCAVCGGKKKLEVHHKMPFHLDPAKELDINNLITLCEEDTDGVNCHLLFGHLGNFRSLNAQIDIDSKIWCDKIAKRP
jgi:5-methylcytosine-specific restriction enzyme A